MRKTTTTTTKNIKKEKGFKKSTELQKANIEVEIYNVSRNCDLKNSQELKQR